jgi:hypothetical protein
MYHYIYVNVKKNKLKKKNKMLKIKPFGCSYENTYLLEMQAAE